MFSDFFDQEMLETYHSECKEATDYLEDTALSLEILPSAMPEIYRKIHTLKGGFGTLGFDLLESAAHDFESLLLEMKGKPIPQKNLANTLLAFCDLVKKDPLTLTADDCSGFHKCVAGLKNSEQVLLPTSIEPLVNQAEEQDFPIEVSADALESILKTIDLQRQAQSDQEYWKSVRLTNQLYSMVCDLQRSNIKPILRKLKKQVIGISEELNKPVQLIVNGNDVRMDIIHHKAVAQILPHMVRNSLDHGIETTEERLALNKPTEARIEINIRQKSQHIVLEIRDDGRGMEPDKIAKKAVQKGLISQSDMDVLSRDERLNLIFLPGFSTRETVSTISGRGIGMDVVNTWMKICKGNIFIETNRNMGTTFELHFPTNPKREDCLILKQNGQLLGFPVSGVREILESHQITEHLDGAVSTMENSWPQIGFNTIDSAFGERAYPYWLILDLMGIDVAFGVDEVLGYHNCLPTSEDKHSVDWCLGLAMYPSHGVYRIVNMDYLVSSWNELMVPA